MVRSGLSCLPRENLAFTSSGCLLCWCCVCVCVEKNNVTNAMPTQTLMRWSVSAQTVFTQQITEIVPETQEVLAVQKFVISLLAFFSLCVEVLG